ncbi:MAG: hypothetical protein BVN30_05175 [Proteobacteria bacterium ST_bin16]|nr:MAG: hypothetical protein BVN30_05175 [Proteobacteria bacterium ST_bin16]
MPSFELKLFSLKQSKVLKIESVQDQDIDEKVVELLINFAYQLDEIDHRISIKSLQQNTLELRENICSFIDRYKHVAPQLNKLKSFIGSLEDGEYFYIFQNIKLETIQIAELGIYLQALNNGLDIAVTQEEFLLTFGDLLSNYDMLAFNGANRVCIGDSDKSKILCRFCGKGAPFVRFKNKAHAISEALGNKGIVCNEECDTCNARFGDGIETDLIALLSLYRAFFGIKGKGSGTPQLKGKNFSVKKVGSGEVNFSILGEDGSFPERVDAHTYEKVSQQNVYRALCKYIISVLPNEHLSAFEECLRWINHDTSFRKLPPTYIRVVNDLYSEYPILSVFIRKNLDNELPHVVGEFRFANIVIVFVMPSSSKDVCSFDEESDLDKFWGISHYSKHAPHSEWIKMNLDSDEKRELCFSVKFEQRV